MPINRRLSQQRVSPLVYIALKWPVLLFLFSSTFTQMDQNGTCVGWTALDPMQSNAKQKVKNWPFYGYKNFHPILAIFWAISNSKMRFSQPPPKKQKSTQKGPNMAKNGQKWKNAIFSKSCNVRILQIFLVASDTFSSPKTLTEVMEDFKSLK